MTLTDKHDDCSCPVLGTVTRWARRKDARPGEILDAALDLFVAKGFAATKMNDIAAAAGVTAGTIYRYYDGKEEMLRAIIRDGIGAKLDEGEQLITQFKGTAPELLAMVIRTWWSLIGATRLSGLPKLIISEANNFPELAELHREVVVRRGEAMIAKALQYGVDRGEFRPMPIESTVKVVVAPVLMAMLWKHAPACETGEFNVDEYLEQVIQTLVFGLSLRSA
ncbi:TetR/AcrR family transcriptional regulator [Chitinimonas sp.]|uniref:TetR/AcrR family transcriptional regulator n=1 Tax=Chitinimonas sp. TaxID=1934313 RepID=UPI0035AF0A89